jgi:hypothetical protein
MMRNKHEVHSLICRIFILLSYGKKQHGVDKEMGSKNKETHGGGVLSTYSD